MVHERPAVAINPFCDTHYTEHLAPLCVLMNIPLLLGDEDQVEAARRYYPGLDARFIHYDDLTPDYIMKNYDVVFRSDIWKMDIIWDKFLPLEQRYGKRLRCVHCPHGFSDKTFWFAEMAHEDICLLYGDAFVDMLTECKALDTMRRHVITGNVRYRYYQKHRTALDAIVDKEVFSQFPKQQRTVLYAPTWNDREESSSFFDAIQAVASGLPSDLNLLVKLHPHMALNEPSRLYQLMGACEQRPNIVFLEDYPLVYPLLAKADLYLGDRSSVGYDFLAFNRPMFFLDQKGLQSHGDRRSYLYRCGTVIAPADYSKTFSIIETGLARDSDYTAERQRVYDYVFAKDTSSEQTRAALIAAYQG
ncbi:MAG: CDP-glycerol glycerophosphotransferase family protein [Chlamydiia bacterium]|nr:CDP-glycerol glycerophosphotransferase family protein [Chlamydiia bacterium]